MKTKHFFTALILSVTLVYFGCSGSGSDGGDGGNQVTSITIQSNQSSLELGGAFTFTVKTNTNEDVTSSSTISIDGTAIAGNSFTASTGGTYIAKAQYNGLETSNLALTVVDNTIVSITIMSSSDTVKIGDTVTFTVFGTNASGVDSNITGVSTITINGNVNPDNRYFVTESSDILASASFDGLNSSQITVTVEEEAVPSSFTKKGVIEDYTGTWCGWCPRVAYGIELVEAESEKVFAIAAHIDDNMQNTYSIQLDNYFNSANYNSSANTPSYPFAALNRETEWTYPEPNNVSQATAYATGTSNVGLSLNSILRGDDMKIHVSTGFTQNMSGTKLVVMILEDGIIASQDNYTSYYGGVDPIPTFMHNHVLRHSITNVLGDAIPAGEQVANNKYDLIYNIDVATTAVQNGVSTGIIAMVVGSDNKVINVQYAKINVDADFD